MGSHYWGSLEKFPKYHLGGFFRGTEPQDLFGCLGRDRVFGLGFGDFFWLVGTCEQ